MRALLIPCLAPILAAQTTPDAATLLGRMQAGRAEAEVAQLRYAFRFHHTNTLVSPTGERKVSYDAEGSATPQGHGLIRRQTHEQGRPLTSDRQAAVDRQIESGSTALERLGKRFPSAEDFRAGSMLGEVRAATFEGRPTLVVALRPRPDAPPKLHPFLAALEGTLTVDAATCQLVRLEGRFVRSLPGRFPEGTQIRFTFHPAPDGTWLPQEDLMRWSIGKGAWFENATRYSDHRRFEVGEGTLTPVK